MELKILENQYNEKTFLLPKGVFECLVIESYRDWLIFAGTGADKTLTRCHCLLTGLTGVWWRSCRSTQIDEMFSIGERSFKNTLEGSSQTFSVLRNIPKIPENAIVYYPSQTYIFKMFG